MHPLTLQSRAALSNRDIPKIVPVLTLPKDILSYICSMLSTKDVLTFSATCKNMRKNPHLMNLVCNRLGLQQMAHSSPVTWKFVSRSFDGNFHFPFNLVKKNLLMLPEIFRVHEETVRSRRHKTDPDPILNVYQVDLSINCGRSDLDCALTEDGVLLTHPSRHSFSAKLSFYPFLLMIHPNFYSIVIKPDISSCLTKEGLEVLHKTCVIFTKMTNHYCKETYPSTSPFDYKSPHDIFQRDYKNIMDRYFNKTCQNEKKSAKPKKSTCDIQ